MMDPEHARIISDLADHAVLFDLSDGLGDDVLDVAVGGVKSHFNAQLDPDGATWAELQSAYKRWKDKHYPGNPIGVQEGLMRDEIDGERKVDPDSAEWTYGHSDEARAEADWFTQGDPEQNRKPRPFADLNGDSIARSDQLLDTHFERGTQ
jgi:hypothetical protein